jgi:hypothetical protein
MKFRSFIIAAAMAAGLSAQAADIDVISDVSTSTTWSSNNVYHLRGVINVTPGATLSIEAGTKVIGYTDVELTTWAGENRDDSSVLVVQAGAKIMAEGTKEAPIVFTSSHDIGQWRPSASEWGNVTILGNAITSDGGNSGGIQDGTCWDNMEGLPVSEFSRYGGTDDDDDSGVLRYVSLRYGGSVMGQANELNGLSMGGVGRETELEYIEVMNNIDDGIEIWGGTAQLKYISIWNIGDDSLDLDEGFRGKVQFGLIVQGYGAGSSQGSGIGDNCLEMDGAERPNEMQPYANPQLFNLTVIGQPTTGDNGMSMRDNMRLQVGNSIFMDIGDRLISFDENNNNADMYNAFHTPHDTYTTDGVDFAGLPYSSMDQFYSPSRSGNWSWVKDCVFFNINDDSDIRWTQDAPGAPETVTTAELGLWDPAMNNVRNASTMPIKLITRDTSAGQPLDMQRVTMLDPRAAGDAVTSVETAPNDGFFTPVKYRGAFSPNYNWLEGWTAAYEYGMTVTTGNSDAPEADIAMGAVISFQSENGVEYSIKQASDVSGPYTEVATVMGDGTKMTYVDDQLSAQAFYAVEMK